MRCARRRPCSAPLRQAGGIPAAADRAGHPRRGNTPRCYACPSPAGRGGDPASIPSAASAPPPAAAGARPSLGNVSSGSPGDRAGMSCDAIGREGSALHRGNRTEPAEGNSSHSHQDTFFFCRRKPGLAPPASVPLQLPLPPPP